VARRADAKGYASNAQPLDLPRLLLPTSESLKVWVFEERAQVAHDFDSNGMSQKGTALRLPYWRSSNMRMLHKLRFGPPLVNGGSSSD